MDPYIPDGEVPKVEHVVLPPGMAIVPAEEVVGAGLIPGDASSVDPRGMPVEETDEPVPMPSGEVAAIVGVGVAIPLTCATAALQAKSAGRIAAAKETLVDGFSVVTVSLGVILSDIGQSLSGDA